MAEIQNCVPLLLGFDEEIEDYQIERIYIDSDYFFIHSKVSVPMRPHDRLREKCEELLQEQIDGELETRGCDKFHEERDNNY